MGGSASQTETRDLQPWATSASSEGLGCPFWGGRALASGIGGFPSPDTGTAVASQGPGVAPVCWLRGPFPLWEFTWPLNGFNPPGYPFHPVPQEDQVIW